jgi:hypothetical protein
LAQFSTLHKEFLATSKSASGKLSTLHTLTYMSNEKKGKEIELSLEKVFQDFAKRNKKW